MRPYTSNLGMQFQIECREGSLRVVEAGTESDVPPIKLQPTSDPDVFIPDSGRLAGEERRFKRDEAGRVIGLVSRGSMARKLVELRS